MSPSCDSFRHVWHSLHLVFCCQHFRRSWGTGCLVVLLDILCSSRKLRHTHSLICYYHWWKCVEIDLCVCVCVWVGVCVCVCGWVADKESESSKKKWWDVIWWCAKKISTNGLTAATQLSATNCLNKWSRTVFRAKMDPWLCLKDTLTACWNNITTSAGVPCM